MRIQLEFVLANSNQIKASSSCLQNEEISLNFTKLVSSLESLHRVEILRLITPLRIVDLCWK